MVHAHNKDGDVMPLKATLEEAWGYATPEYRVLAEVKACELLENLVHYPIKHGTHYHDDIKFLAASLAAMNAEV